MSFTVGDGEIVDKGDDFFASILRTDTWTSLADINNNVCLNADQKKIWHFKKQSDGSYTIQNVSTERYLDLYCSTDENGGNVQTCDYNGSDAQMWFIYGRWSGEYYLKPKCTTNRVLDIDRASENAQVWDLDYNDNQKLAIYLLNKPGAADVSCSAGNKYKPTRFWWNATEDTNNYCLKIYKDKLWEGESIEVSTNGTMCSVNLPAGYYEAYVDSSNDYSYTMSNNVIKFTVTEGTPETINPDFYAYVINTATDAYLIHDDKYNVCFSKSDNIDEALKVWHFVRNDDDSFTIHTSVGDGVLDVFDNGDENGSNIDVWGSNDGSNQKWYVQGVSPEYYIKPAYTNRVLDLYGGVYSDNVNAELWEKNGTDAQLFKIVEIEQPVIKYNMNGGKGTISNQTKEYGKDLTLSSTKPTQTGYEFLGWNTNKDAATAEYQPGAKYTANIGATLYAIWEKEEILSSETDEPSDSDTSTLIDSDEIHSDIESSDTEEVSDVSTDSNSESNTDIVSDSDISTNINSDTESDSEIDVDSSTDITSDSDTESDPDSDSENDSDSETYIPGDINGDGMVNMKDVTRLHQYINGWDVYVKEQALDVNGDGKVSMKDLTRLHQYINGWNVTIS